MNESPLQSSLARRLFLTRLGVGVGVLSASAVSSSSAAQVAGDTHWSPARHAQDDWLDQIPGQHRVVFDTTTADAMGMGLKYALNFYFANQQNYNLRDNELAVIVVARDKSTAFAYNDMMWAKYGKQLSAHATFLDPSSKEPPRVNVFNRDSVLSPPFLDLFIKRGGHFAVCQIATQAIALMVAKATGTDQAKIVEELDANLVGNAHPVSAGIVAVTRAQERGYALVHAS